MKFYSVGHSNVTATAFLALLKNHGITVLVDARSKPYSRYNPQFRREELKKTMAENGIEYIFLGDRIGGKPADPKLLLGNGRADYEKLAASTLYLEGIEQLIELGARARVSFMCAEADFRNCHRYWLITRTLVTRGIAVEHILQSGETVTSSRADFVAAQPSLF